MVPVRIAVKGFLSYRDGGEVTFDGAPLWMLCGRNGAGKSALFDAITFALYGAGRFGEDVVQEYIHHDARDMSVEFDFDLGDRRYRVKRTASRSKRSTFHAFEFDRTSGLPIPLPGIDQEKPLKEWVEGTLGLDCDTFVAAVLLRQGESDRLLSARDKDRAQMMARIIDLSAYERLRDAVNRKANELEGEEKRLQSNLTRLTGNIEREIRTSVERFGLELHDYPLHEKLWQSGEKLADTLAEIERDTGSEVKRLSDRLLVLTHVKTTLDGWKSRVVARAQGLSQRATYDAILESKRHAEIEWRATRLEELTLILSPLKDWAEARKDWRDSQCRHEQAVTAIHATEERKEKQEAELKAAEQQQEGAEEQFRGRSAAVVQADSVLKLHERRLDQLRAAEGQPNCLVCGQKLDPGHIEQETNGLLEQIQRAKQDLERARGESNTAEKARKAAKATVQRLRNDLDSLKGKAGNLESDRRLAEQARIHADETAQRALQRLRDAATELSKRIVAGEPYAPEPVVSRLLASPDTNVAAALADGSYPTDQDIEAAETEKKALAGADKEHRALAKAQEEAGQLEAAIRTCESQIQDDEVALGQAAQSEDLTAILAVRSSVERGIQAEVRHLSEIAALGDPSERERKARTAIERIRTAAGKPSQEAEQELNYCQEARQAQEEQRDDARQCRSDLCRLLKDRADTIDQLEETARRARVHRTLERKLDRNHLQSYLRTTAEQAIVMNANAILQRLSDGMLHLALETGTGRTLDLRVTDYEKGRRAMLPAALSGSQKFRVSVALALGIGQYACGLSQGGIKSVIIDEGFGSLDREGREKMIEELHNLGRVLDRILVVSHQEEFESAFAHRWRITVENGSARAEMVA